MRILHVTHNPQWFIDHFNFICQQTGHTGESQQISKFDITEDDANAIWAQNKDYYNSFDAIHVSHLATLSRIFLQNGWTKPLYIWLCFRFNYFCPPRVDPAYHELIKAARLKPNVKFFAASIHDKLYIQNVLGDFPVEIVAPFVYVNNSIKVPTPSKDKFYIISKHNETVAMNFKALADEMGIPNYMHPWDLGEPDLRGVRGIIHLPYNNLSRGFLENLALENVFFLPSLEFLKTLIATRQFWWDIERIPQHIELSEWYRPENQNLFIYFNSFEHLKEIVNSPLLDGVLKIKKENIRMFNIIHNDRARREWGEVFS